MIWSRWKAIAAAVVVGAVGYGLWWTGGPSGVPRGPVGPELGPASASAYRIGFAGDTLIGDGAAKRIKKHGVDYVLQDARPLVAGDVFILNLEAPLTRLRRQDVPGSERAWTYDMHPTIAADLRGLGVDHVGFANNHALDRGPKGLLDTRASAKLAQLGLFGAGAGRAEAEAPLLLSTPHGAVAVVGFSYAAPESHEAADGPGVVFLSPRNVVRGMELARAAGAAHVIAFVHWGRNYSAISNWQRHAAHWFADAGYDVVIGHGPHVQQPVGKLDGTVIVYSLGNFVFNSPGRFELFDQPTYGLTATVLLDGGRLDRLELRCLQADNQETLYRPRPCTSAEAADSLGRLGGLIHRIGDIGVVAL